MSIFASKTWVSDRILTLPSLWGEIYDLAWNQPSTQTEIHMMQTRSGLKPQNSDLDLDFKWWDWGWGNNPPNPNPHKYISILNFFKTLQYTTFISAYRNSFGYFSWEINLTLSHCYLLITRCLTQVCDPLYRKSSQNPKGSSSSVQCAVCYSQRKEKRERKQRCRETSAISCHTKGCQVLFIYIDDLMMIVWYLKLLPPTRDALKLLSISLLLSI